MPVDWETVRECDTKAKAYMKEYEDAYDNAELPWAIWYLSQKKSVINETATGISFESSNFKLQT